MLLSTHNKSVKLPVYGDPGVDSSMNRPYSGWYVGTDFLRATVSAMGVKGVMGGHALIAATVGYVVDDRLQLGQNFGLAEGEFRVSVVIVERHDHVLDLARTCG